MRISDWSSDVCSSDLGTRGAGGAGTRRVRAAAAAQRAVAVALPLRPDGVAVALAYLRRAATDAEGLTTALDLRHERIGRASCRERVCQYVSISVVAVYLKKKKKKRTKIQTK